MKLTKTQKIAVETTHTNILISAGAGAGKTRVLVERFLYFVISAKARVTEILTLTFTDKAANEMKSRIMERFRDLDMVQARRDLELAYISTIHAFAARLLKEHPVEAGVPPDFAVIESEESELLQDQTLDELIETQCLPGSDVFELLKAYGENAIREGLKKTLVKARTEGLGLEAFFARQSSLSLSFPHALGGNPSTGSPTKSFGDDRYGAAELFERVGESNLAADWKRFESNPKWDWKMVEDFRNWSAGFKRKGGKETKVYWKEINTICAQLLGYHLDQLAKPWREKFEKMALAFEASYEARKFENGVLDFDDLQIRALALLTSDGPGNRKLLERYQKQFKFVMVDEYQDVNPLQVRFLECFSAPAEKKDQPLGKMFFVGDYKQSIYGFRGTSPQHFLEKETHYKKGGGLWIEMLENFRTQKPVLQFINTLFEKIWAEDGLENAGLIAEAEEDSPAAPELLVIRKKEDESIEQARMREAGAIALKVRELREAGIPYGKMAVLFQAVTNVGIYEYALKSAGISYFVVSGRGFYHQPEVRDMMSLLSVLENPLLDIPLAAALRSPLFHISDETLFWLSQNAKKENENAPLYQALKNVETIEEIRPEEKARLISFRNFFAELIQIKDRLYLSEFLEWILRRTSYELPVLADRQGVRRYANLRKLVSLAREEESRERMSLGDFIRLVQSLEAREIRESEAQVEAEQSGRVVRLMTIHAAKGLEFPICFVADLAHQSRNPESRDFLAESGIGYSFKIPNAVTLDLEKPGAYEKISESMEKREAEEWKRLFYVALTRAKKQLILSGVYEEKKEPKEKFSDMSSWMEWVMTGAEELPIKVNEISEDVKGLVRQAPKIFAEEEGFQKLLKEEINLEKLFPEAKERASLSKKAEELYRGFESYEAPAGRVIDLPVSAYCAFAKDKLEYWRIYEMGYSSTDHEKEYVREVEQEEESISAADFGTRIHRALEVMDFKNPIAHVSRIIKELFGDLGKTKQEEARTILTRFFESDIFKKLQSAKRVHKEISFIINERHGRIDGVIDVLFQDAGGDWHILDYKTAVGDEKRVKEAAYDLQMGIYAAAVQELLKVTPKSAVLYFLKNQWAQVLPLSPEFLKAQMDRVRQLQQEMLDFRTSKVLNP